MNGNNFISLIGRLGQDPERKVFESGKSIVEFSLATPDNYRDAAGNTVERTQWHRIKAFGKQGDVLHQYCSRGRQLSIVGTLRYNAWTDNSGNNRKTAEVIVDTFTFIDSKREGGGNYQAPTEQQQNSPLGPVQKLTEAPQLVNADGGDGGDLPF